ncbi:MAG: DNA mismatch repair endonuclease MutL [Synergistaceae bacterium]|nr:DNA mismatch repair endonuclease MutL [Synergistaceae bacterium]
MSIKALPASVWTRIAAGEVLERPASAVKELIENSLDAGAKRIKVRLWDGGRLKIVVEDDGCGILFDDLPLALTPHATSKINNLDDLEAISTLGYRGEALASIAAVSDIEIVSKARDAESGGIIKSQAGRINEHEVINCAVGTRIQIDNLFSNFPARRKFLKSASGELRRAAVCVREYAVCRPEISFMLEHDGKEIFASDGSGDKKRLLSRLWNGEQDVKCVKVISGHIKLECWHQQRKAIRGNASRSDIMAFVNLRAVNDPVIKGAVNAISKEFAGNWALFFTLDAPLVDVNIHPAKAEVKFRYPSEIYDVMLAAAHELSGEAEYKTHEPKFNKGGGKNLKLDLDLDNNNNLDADLKKSNGWRFNDPDWRVMQSDSVSEVNNSASENLNEVNEYIKDEKVIEDEDVRDIDIEEDINVNQDEAYINEEYLGDAKSSLASRIEEMNRVNEQKYKPEREAQPPVEDADIDIEEDVKSYNANFREKFNAKLREKEKAGKHIPHAAYMGQIESGYLVFNTFEGLVLMDPHAAHERINYERVRNEAKRSQGVQKLLVPVALSPSLALETEEFIDVLNKFGLEIEKSDGNLYLKSVPLAAVGAEDGKGDRNIDPENLLRASVRALKYESGDKMNADLVNNILWRAWADVACKASVKLTNDLNNAEAMALWRDMHECEQPFFCPHGRPTLLKINNEELVKHFGRSSP